MVDGPFASNVSALGGENVSGDCIDALHMMHISYVSKLFGFVVKMLQGFTLK